MASAVVVELDALILGRTLEFPIHDHRGLLLLGEGAELTAETRDRIRQRGVTQVVMHPADAARVTVQTTTGSADAVLAKLEEHLNSRLETLIKAGGLEVKNAGPSLLREMLQTRRTAAAGKLQALDNQRQQHVLAMRQIHDAFGKPGDVSGSRVYVAADQALNSLVDDLSGTLQSTLVANQSASIDEQSWNTAILSMALGIQMGLNRDNVRKLGIAGLVQNLGMRMIPDRILKAERPLTAIELVDVQKHPIHTVNMLQRLKGIPEMLHLVAYQVHERPDGTGYPKGRKLKSIHLFARVIHVADVYCALTAPRPHRPALMAYAAMEYLLKMARKLKVDPAVVRCLLQLLSLFPVGSYVALSDGTIGRVMHPNPNDFTKPLILRVQDRDGRPIELSDASAFVDLSECEITISQALPSPGKNEVGLDESFFARPAGDHATIPTNMIGSVIDQSVMNSTAPQSDVNGAEDGAPLAATPHGESVTVA